jgi:hypothetical protein
MVCILNAFTGAIAEAFAKKHKAAKWRRRRRSFLSACGGVAQRSAARRRSSRREVKMMPQSRFAPALAVALALMVAPPAVALDASEAGDRLQPDSGEFSSWTKEQIARLNQELDVLKERLNDLGERAGPALDEAKEGVSAMRDKLEVERPALEAAGETFLERLKTTAAIVGDELRQTLDRIDRRLSDRR